MMPVNTKSLFATLCSYMDKLDKGEIDSTKAIAMSRLVGQANNLLIYELKRAALMTNQEFKKEHRSIELKTFDSDIKQLA